MTGIIIDNRKPTAVVVTHDGKKTFDTFAEACAYADEIRDKRILVWPDDQTSFPFVNAFNEERMDRIGQNGPDGLAYDGVGKEWLEQYGLLGDAK
ncbi:hypothetical protein IQ22_04248 [Pseudomonas duriflava]|uniref:Uncharacterized protein n=1 Tax=Pseudomonas duriflava TaxID=459528 RepID=A0A562PUE2_9PSED|nr:hypothetical protein [Pseudomonas duriflava]TWI48055.1 hypothetical protein IQ22_04248 [Pseudomonas duriflava]